MPFDVNFTLSSDTAAPLIGTRELASTASIPVNSTDPLMKFKVAPLLIVVLYVCVEIKVLLLRYIVASVVTVLGKATPLTSLARIT